MAKTASFAVVHFSVAFCVGYALTGSIVSGGLIALVEPMVNTIAFYFHEKIWQSRWLLTRLGSSRVGSLSQ